jgi:site-specific DNA recombinase
MRKAILYTRVSTTRQVEKGVSLENQEARLRQYAAFHGFKDVILITDEGLSGKSTDRPGFQRVMQAVQRSEVEAVMVYSLSRFARSTSATLDAAEKMQVKGIAFHSLSEQIDSSSAMGRFFVTIIAGLAQLEREQISERTISALEHKRRNGERTGQVPYGMRANGKMLEINHEEQDVIRSVHALRKAGLSLTSIATTLQNDKVKNRAGETSWTKQQVARILTKKVETVC